LKIPVSAVRFRLWAPKYRETPRNNVSLGFFIACDLMGSGPFLDQGALAVGLKSVQGVYGTVTKIEYF